MSYRLRSTGAAPVARIGLLLFVLLSYRTLLNSRGQTNGPAPGGMPPAINEALESARRVIPLLAGYRAFTGGTATLSGGGVLDYYIGLRAGDPARFADFDEYVRDTLAGTVSS